MSMVPTLAGFAAANVARQGPTNTENLKKTAKNYGAKCAELITTSQLQIDDLKPCLDEEEPLVEATYSNKTSKFALCYLLLRYRSELMDALTNAHAVDDDKICWRALAMPAFVNAINPDPNQNKAPFKLMAYVPPYPRLDAIIQCIIKLNVDLTDDKGRSALMWAVENELTLGTGVAERLLIAGARVEKTDIYGRSAIDRVQTLTYQASRDEIMPLLQKYRRPHLP